MIRVRRKVIWGEREWLHSVWDVLLECGHFEFAQTARGRCPGSTTCRECTARAGQLGRVPPIVRVRLHRDKTSNALRCGASVLQGGQ